MALLVGIVLALAVGLMARSTGLDRDRGFYPTVMIVIGFLYSLFAAIGASPRVLVIESVLGAAFLAAAIIGLRSSLWIVAAALAAHGMFDLAHGRLVSNAGVPPWWPEFCLTYDVTAAAFLAWLLRTGRIRAAA